MKRLDWRGLPADSRKPPLGSPHVKRWSVAELRERWAAWVAEAEEPLAVVAEEGEMFLEWLERAGQARADDLDPPAKYAVREA